MRLKRLNRRIGGLLKRAVLGPRALGVVVDSWNGRFVVDPRDYGVSRRLYKDGAYDRAAVETLLGLIDGDARVCVLGTHIGAVLVPLAKRAREVVAFEPNPDTLALLEMNLRLNDVSNLTLHRAAVGSAPGEARFYKNTVNSGQSKVRPSVDRPEFIHDRPETVTVPVVRVDDVADGPFDLIVMDVEGSEIAALAGMPRALAASRHLYIEYAPSPLKLVSGGTAETLLQLLPQHFVTLRVMGEGEPPPVPRERFLEAIRALPHDPSAATDLLFSAEPSG